MTFFFCESIVQKFIACGNDKPNSKSFQQIDRYILFQFFLFLFTFQFVSETNIFRLLLHSNHINCDQILFVACFCCVREHLTLNYFVLLPAGDSMNASTIFGLTVLCYTMRTIWCNVMIPVRWPVYATNTHAIFLPCTDKRLSVGSI